MYCQNCGAALSEKAKFCKSCGSSQGQSTQTEHGEKAQAAQERPVQTAQEQPVQAIPRNTIPNLIGFSSRINDPAFAKYMKNTNRWSGIFAVILAIAAVVGFFIYGETSSEAENPEALFIGLGVGGMFLLIALFTIIGKSRSKTWDGTVVDKKIRRKSREQHSGNDDSYWVDYKEYTVFIRSDSGKTHKRSVEDNDTVYNYYQVGDRVRHHKGLNTYEKYDKSKDSIIFCNACASLNDIHDDYCFRCKCPLLK